MTKTKKTVAAILAVCAVSATAVAGTSMSNLLRGTTVFANTAVVSETTAVKGSEEKPALAEAGVNTISYMVVGGNAEMGYKELVYYMQFTPAESGLYEFTHSNPDIGIGDIYSETDAPYGEWNDDFTVFSVELTKGVEYTFVVNNFDWMLDLSGETVGAEYNLEVPATITIKCASAAAGSSRDNAIPCKLDGTIIVPKGHDPVWYSYTGEADSSYYVIVSSGSAQIRRNFTTVTVTNGYREYSGTVTCYICAIPTETESAEIQLLDASEQSEGTCIVTAEALPANHEVGGGVWYEYTVGNTDETASLKPVEGAYVVENKNEDEEGNVTVEKTTLCGTVAVYEGYKYVGTLSDGVFTPAVLPKVEEGQEVPTYSDVTLSAGKTYHFYAPAYEYKVTDENGDVVQVIEILSSLIIK